MSKALSSPTIVRPRTEATPIQFSAGPLGTTSSYDLHLALATVSSVNALELFPELKIKTFVIRAKLVIRLAATVLGRHQIIDELADRGDLSPKDVNHVALADGTLVSDPNYAPILAVAVQQLAERDAEVRMAGYRGFMADSDALGIAD